MARQYLGFKVAGKAFNKILFLASPQLLQGRWVFQALIYGVFLQVEGPLRNSLRGFGENEISAYTQAKHQTSYAGKGE